MKNISPSTLPHFHGLTTEHPDTFLFEFVVLCRTYDYAEDEQKLKLFPSTLKGAALRWFMGLPGNSITTWAQMQQAFNAKYWVDKSKEGSSRSCSIIAAILEPTIFLAPLPGKRQSIGDCCFSSIFPTLTLC